MLGISTINTTGFRNFRNGNSGQKFKATGTSCSVLNMHQNGRHCVRAGAKRRASRVCLKIELKNACLVLATVVVFSGAGYLFQVNSLAAKGYELKELQSSLAGLQESNKKGRIQEVELMSMYNIEKVTGDLDLVNLSDVTYLEPSGTVAMK